MKLALEVTTTHDKKKRVIVAAFPDFIAFENRFNRSVAKFETELTLTDLAFLAWNSDYRAKKTGLDFETWCDEIETLELADQAEAMIVPLEISQPTG